MEQNLGAPPFLDEGPKDLRERFGVTPLLDIEINAGGVGWVGLTPEADHDLRLDVTSAVIARFMGVTPRTARRHLKEVQEHTSKDEPLRQLCYSHLQRYDQFYRTIDMRANPPIGVFAFDLAMIRSRASVELMLVTARQGFLIEPCLIGRSLMEQFAYALHVWETDDDSVILLSRPQSLLRSLKMVNPQAGRAYGMLSRLSHYDPKMHYALIGGPMRNAQNDESATVIQRSWRFKIVSLAWVYFILDLKFRTFERCYGSHEHFEILSPLRESIRNSYDEFFDGVDFPAVEQVRSLLT